MLNEWQEFLNYTEPVAYRASGKKDTAWLGRFTFEALRDFSGMNRILTILARGFLFHAPDGTLLPGDPRERISFAYDGLCAWCSIPERRGAPHEEWQHRTDFAPLHEQFPKLVDEEGWGWFGRHFHRAMQFALAHPDLVHKNYAASAGKLDKLFDQEWRSKVLQYQTESLSTLTEGAWTIRFDDMIADALELGPCAARSRSCRRNWQSGLNRSALRKCLPISCSPWWPTTWPTARRTATGWCSL